jgi:hypothetical protein
MNQSISKAQNSLVDGNDKMSTSFLLIVCATHRAAASLCRGLRPDVPDYTPAPFAALMRCCWAALPSSRPSFSEITVSLHTMHKEAS